MQVTELGNKIRILRIEKGLTCDDLGDKIGLNKGTISRYERGLIKNPKLPVIAAIAKELDVNPSWLLGKENLRQIENKYDIIKILENLKERVNTEELFINQITLEASEINIINASIDLLITSLKK